MSTHFESIKNYVVTVCLGVTCVLHVFTSYPATMLHHSKVLLVHSLSLTMCLLYALVTSIMRQVNPAELQASEQPLKITLMLLGIPVENSKQYGSK